MSKPRGCVASLLTGVLFLALFCGGPLYLLKMLADQPARTPEEQAEHNAAMAEINRETNARRFAQEAVLASLKYPDNADIHWGSEVKPLGDDLYTVTGKVDAMNGFGAKITHRWSVQIRVEGDTYNVLNVSVSE